jgi:trehalose-6-phosphate synthase
MTNYASNQLQSEGSPQFPSLILSGPQPMLMQGKRLVIVSHLLPYEVEERKSDKDEDFKEHDQASNWVSVTDDSKLPKGPRKRTHSDWNPLFYDEHGINNLSNHTLQDDAAHGLPFMSYLQSVSPAALEKDVDIPSYTISPSQHGNVGLFNAIHATRKDIPNYVYVGGLIINDKENSNEGVSDSILSKEGENFGIKSDLSQVLHDRYRCIPVPLYSSELEKYYKGFCKQTLWPIFHYLHLDYLVAKRTHNDADWESYQKMNHAFAQVIIQNYRPGDVLWIHDYHLLLLPAILRARLPDAIIGFFLHLPFPSSELFKCLHVREELLQGVLGADMVGFQTYSYVRGFLQTTSRILGYEATTGYVIQLGPYSGEYEEDEVDHEKMNGESTTDISKQAFTLSHDVHRHVVYNAHPIGLHFEALEAKRNKPSVLEMIETLKKKYQDKKILIGRDKLDPSKGVRQKLLAYEQFLTMYPEWISKVVLIQVCLSLELQPTNRNGLHEQSSIHERTERALRAMSAMSITPQPGVSSIEPPYPMSRYNESDNTPYFKQISQLVSRINSTYGNLDYTPVVFLHQDISFEHYLALLSIADACIISSLRDGMNLTSHEYIVCQEGHYGSLILSEFTGAFHSLGSAAIPINPWNRFTMAKAMNQALTMSIDERKQRHEQLYRYVIQHHAANWVQKNIQDIIQASSMRASKIAASSPTTASGMSSILEGFCSDQGRKLILFDSNAFEWISRNTTSPWRGILSALKQLMNSPREDPSIHVLFHLDHSRREIDTKYRYLKYFNVTAEHGAFFRAAAQTKSPTANQWNCTLPTLVEAQDTWKTKVKEILAYYTERTPGSHIIEYQTSILWDYGQTEQVLGQRQAKECQTHIQDVIGVVFPIHVLPKTNRNQLWILPLNATLENAWKYWISTTLPSTASPQLINHPLSPSSLDCILIVGINRDPELDTFFSQYIMKKTLSTFNLDTDLAHSSTDSDNIDSQRRVFYHDIGTTDSIRQLYKLLKSIIVAQQDYFY